MGRAGFHDDDLAGGQSPHFTHPTWDPHLILTGFGMGILQSPHHQFRISNNGLWPFAEGHGIQATQISGSPFRFGPPFRLQHQLQGHHQAIEPSAINHHMVNPELVGDLGLHGEVTIGMNIKRDTWVTHPWSRHHYCRKTALASVQNRNGISDHAVETQTLLRTVSACSSLLAEAESINYKTTTNQRRITQDIYFQNPLSTQNKVQQLRVPGII